MRDEGVKTIAIWLSVAVAITNLVVIIWKGGELSHMVKQDSLRIDRLEALGSGRLQSHIEVADEVRKSTEARLTKLEQACESIVQIRESIAQIKKDMDWLTRRSTQPTSAHAEKQTGSSW